MLRLLKLVDDGGHDLRFAGALAVDLGLAMEFPDVPFAARERDVEIEPVAGDDDAPEADGIEAHQVDDLARVERSTAERQERAGLGHGLELQDAGHHGVAGEMSLEELLVGGE